MSGKFEVYEQDFKRELGDFATLSNRFSYAQNDDAAKKKMVDEMKRIIKVAEGKYKSMEAEASFMRKEEYSARLRKFLMEFEEAKKKLMTQERDFMEKLEKKQLFEKRNKSSNMGQKKDIRDRYIDANDRAHDHVGLLDDAHRDLLSAITTTQNSNQALTQDRDKLLRVDEKNKNINRMLVQAGQKEDKIMNREVCKRCLLWIAIIILFVTDVFLIFYKLILNHDKK